MGIDQTNSKSSCHVFSIAVLHRSYSENSIHFFDLPQTSIGTTHSDRSLDSFSGALGQAVYRIQYTFG